MKTAYIKCIGNGQITIPKTWRTLLGFGEKPIKATLKGNKVIIEAISDELPEWEISKVRLNSLSAETQKVVLDGRNQYLSANTKNLVTSAEFLNEIK